MATTLDDLLKRFPLGATNSPTAPGVPAPAGGGNPPPRPPKLLTAAPPASPNGGLPIPASRGGLPMPATAPRVEKFMGNAQVVPDAALPKPGWAGRAMGGLSRVGNVLRHPLVTAASLVPLLEGPLQDAAYGGVPEQPAGTPEGDTGSARKTFARGTPPPDHAAYAAWAKEHIPGYGAGGGRGQGMAGFSPAPQPVSFGRGAAAPAPTPFHYTGPRNAPATPVSGAVPPEANQPGKPIDLKAFLTGQGQPGLPLPHSTLTETANPDGRVMGLDRVGPGQGFVSAPNGVTYEATGGQVRKFQGGQEQPLRGTVSVLEGDQTARTNELNAQHQRGMDRLRQGLPYDEAEFQAMQQAQTQAAPPQRDLVQELTDAATGPTFNPQDVAKQKFVRRNRKLLAELAQEQAGLQSGERLERMKLSSARETAQNQALVKQLENILNHQQAKELKGMEIEAADKRANTPSFRAFQPKSTDEMGATVYGDPVFYDTKTGVPAPGAQPKAEASVPPGMKQIGTSGGKPVFEDAQGKRFITG